MEMGFGRALAAGVGLSADEENTFGYCAGAEMDIASSRDRGFGDEWLAA